MQRGNISKGLERSEGESSSFSFYFKKSFFFLLKGQSRTGTARVGPAMGIRLESVGRA